MSTANIKQAIETPGGSAAGVVYTPGQVAQRGPSLLSSALVSTVLAQAVIRQSIEQMAMSARGGFPPWQGGREIRRHVSL